MFNNLLIQVMLKFCLVYSQILLKFLYFALADAIVLHIIFDDFHVFSKSLIISLYIFTYMMKIEHVFINFPNLYLILIWLINKIAFSKYDFIQIIYYDHFKIKHIYVYLRRRIPFPTISQVLKFKKVIT